MLSEKQPEFSKRLIADIRALLWVVTLGGLLLAAYCIRTDYAVALCYGRPPVDSAWNRLRLLSQYGKVRP